MRRWTEFQDALIRHAYKAEPRGPHITRYAMYRALKDVLAAEDGPDKRAIIISGSEYLAKLAGLHKCQKLSLTYPEFTMENLAVADQSCDFVISDQVLQHCQAPDDVARETMRVLKPGGHFIHTTCFINVVHGAPSDFYRFTPHALETMFPLSEAKGYGWGNRLATDLMENGYRMFPVPDDPENPIHQIAMRNEPEWPVSTWVIGRRQNTTEAIAPTISTRRARPSNYTFAPKPAKFGLVTCVRNEAPYLLEWIAHHRLLGFEQITIYDNESNDATSDILGPLSKAGIINAVYWPSQADANKQVSAYNDAQIRLKPSVEWCAFMDLDEFLILDEGLGLDSLLPTDPGASAVGIPWRIYGSAGRKFRATQQTIERFVRCAEENNDHVKSLVRLRDLKFMNVHVPLLAKGRIVDLSGAEIDYETRGKLERITKGHARINHYFCRSAEEFECKRLRGRGAVAPGSADAMRAASAFLPMDVNSVENLEALRYVGPTREEIVKLRALL